MAYPSQTLLCLCPRLHTPAQVALPELDGALEPIVFAGRDSNTGKSHSLPDRISNLCARAVNWAKLRKKKNAEKKLAITVFSFPPDKGNVGTAAYLNVFGSIFRVLKELQREGYDVGPIPSSETELIQSVSGGTRCHLVSLQRVCVGCAVGGQPRLPFLLLALAPPPPRPPPDQF